MAHRPAKRPLRGIAARQQGKGAERAAEAFRLRVEGHEFSDIAARLGVSRGAAFAAYHRQLAVIRELVSEDEIREQVTLEAQRLDRALAKAFAILENIDHDPDVRLRAIDRIVRISERRGRLLGLDQPAHATLAVAVADLSALTDEQEREEMAAWSGPNDEMGICAIAAGPEAVQPPVVTVQDAEVVGEWPSE